MYIKRARIVSYSSFDDSGWIEFDPHINVVIGENNSGKSALLSSLRPQIDHKPHKRKGRYAPADIAQSQVDLDIICSAREYLSITTNEQFTFCMPFPDRLYASDDDVIGFWNSSTNITFRCRRTPGSGTAARDGQSIEWSGPTIDRSYEFQIQAGNLCILRRFAGITDTMPQIFSSATFPTTYYFSAQRLNIGSCTIGDSNLVNSNASNLPNVLAYLQGSRRVLFDEIQDSVREVLPSVEAISVTPRGGQQHILVRSDRDEDAEELAFPLDECGTGVAQAIAILSAVITSKSSVFIIDEINSFLHPSAVKRLVNLFRTKYPHHQYIFSCHSSDVISAAEPHYVHVVERAGYQSQVRRIDASDLSSLRKAAFSLGISMLDVFGHEYVVWVEGPTEEVCFRRILSHFGRPLPAAVALSKVPDTGEFTRKATTKKSLLRIYKAVAETLAPLNRGMSFALDRERLSDDESQIVFSQTDGELRLLPRRCIENYFLNPRAISMVLGKEIDLPISEEAATAAFQEIGSSAEFLKGRQTFNSSDWLQSVDGATLLGRLFTSMSSGMIEYKKTRHGQMLVDEILRSDESSLRELFDFVDERVSKAIKSADLRS